MTTVFCRFARTLRGGRVALLVSFGVFTAVPAFASAPAWQPDVFYAAGSVVAYNGGDYSALVNQTDYSGTGWNPTTATLWSYVGPDSGSSGSGSERLGGVHFWSFDRDNDCAPGSASPTCNSYGQAGRLGFTTAFLAALGL